MQEPRPEAVHHVLDAASGLEAVIVIDDTTLGPAFGGIRIARYPSLAAAEEDAAGLARAMTWKCSLAELAGGGGKGVVRADGLVDRRAACARLGAAVEALGGVFRTAGDLGTTAADLDAIASATRFVARESVVGDLGDATALGVVAAVRAVAARLGCADLRDVTVSVQGLGSIGAAVACRLARAGARPFVADVDPAAVERVARVADVQPLSAGSLLARPVDVLVPCARGGVIDESVAAALPARAIVGGANRVLATPRAGEILWRRGVLHAPDFVANAGAVIRGGLAMLRGAPGSDEEIERIGARVAALLDEARERGEPPEVVAERRARARIAAASRAS
jgi:leucine dehydrogenase